MQNADSYKNNARKGLFKKFYTSLLARHLYILAQFRRVPPAFTFLSRDQKAAEYYNFNALP